MLFMGRDGYIAATRRIVKAARRVARFIQRDEYIREHLQLLGNCDTSVVCFASRDEARLNTYAVTDCMTKGAGWSLNTLQNPPSVHLCVTLPVTRSVDAFLADLKTAVVTVLADPQWNERASVGVYGMTAAIPPGVTGVITKHYLDAAYGVYSGDEGDVDSKGVDSQPSKSD